MLFKSQFRELSDIVQQRVEFQMIFLWFFWMGAIVYGLRSIINLFGKTNYNYSTQKRTSFAFRNIHNLHPFYIMCYPLQVLVSKQKRQNLKYWSYYNYQQRLKMSIKRPVLPTKDFSKDTQDLQSKKIDQKLDQKVRILQDNLVFVTALPIQLADKDKLSSDLYFGRYGAVSKLIINPPFPTKKAASYQAYVTYDLALDASLAIVALDGYKIYDRPLKVSFGTTKYCSHFLKGNQCPNVECFYLHNIDRKKEVSSGDTRTIFKQQNQKALDNVLDNLQQLAGRVLQSDLQQVEEGFPSITEVFDYLLDNDFVSVEQIDKAFQTGKSKRKPIEIPKLEMKVQSEMDGKQREREKDPRKLVKSNSHSTMSTPTKIIDEITANTKKNQQKCSPKTQKKVQPKQQKKVKPKTQQKQKQVTRKQNAIGSRQLKLQQKIQKLIIKELLKKSNNECRSRFVQGVVASSQECSRLKGIVQKYLITHN